MSSIDRQFGRLLQADERGVRLEIAAGLPIWEAHPVPKHQRAVDRIRQSITPPPDLPPGEHGYGCVHLANVYVQFPDGSLKRPDISVFCHDPEEEEDAISQVPDAVIEVINKGYEARDLEIGPHFYLSQGVKDIVVFDPYTLLVLHERQDGARRHISPIRIQLECGCTCDV